jgi:uncharacterized protein YdeI (YjbR/CyaY-like superfamily)
VVAGDREQIEPADRSRWRSWLAAHHRISPGAWVVLGTRSGPPGLTLDDAVEEALCFGWIDSTLHRLGDGRRALLFTPRRPHSTWAQSSKRRVGRLVAQGQMTTAGLAAVERAKADGSWAALDDIDALIIPADLRAALAAEPAALAGFQALTPSKKKSALWWISSARTAPTRARRIKETVTRAKGSPPH